MPIAQGFGTFAILTYGFGGFYAPPLPPVPIPYPVLRNVPFVASGGASYDGPDPFYTPDVAPSNVPGSIDVLVEPSEPTITMTSSSPMVTTVSTEPEVYVATSTPVVSVESGDQNE
jgi:hypothetical protein